MYLVRIEAKKSSQPWSIRRSFLSGVRFASTFALAAVTLGLLSGCGNTYRPIVAAINPVGPAAQPQKFAVAVSSPSSTTPGLVTLVDFAGDTVLITANLGISPYYLNLNGAGTTGYTLNHDGTLTSFDISTQLQTKDVLQSTLLPCSNPAPCPPPLTVYPDNTSTYITQPGRDSVAQLQGSPAALKQEFPIPSSYTPVYVSGFPASTRAYILSQNTSGGAGTATAIETASSSLSTTIPVGAGPIYGVMTSDGKREFVLNQGDGTVSVINSQTNTLDIPPAGSTNPIALGTGTAPSWADLAPTLNELVVANAGNGTTPGSVSIINIPLCSAAALPTNPNCDPNNPFDANGFGQILATVKVGISPIMVAALQDGSKAYVINQHDSTVSVINLTTNTVTATIPVPLTPNPTFIAATTGTPTGKVYVTSPSSNTMTIIRTDTDTIDTTVDLQGKGVMVRVTAP